MKLSDKLDEFLEEFAANAQEHDPDFREIKDDSDNTKADENENENEVDNSQDDMENEDENIEEFDYGEEISDKEKIELNIKILYDALVEIKEKLDNVKLSPFKRFVLQLKLDLLETKLDKQFAKLYIEKYKDAIEDRIERDTADNIKKLEEKQDEMDEIFDRKDKIEKEILALSSNITDKEKTYNNNGKNFSC